jgi:hypothetical protein
VLRSMGNCSATRRPSSGPSRSTAETSWQGMGALGSDPGHGSRKEFRTRAAYCSEITPTWFNVSPTSPWGQRAMSPPAVAAAATPIRTSSHREGRGVGGPGGLSVRCEVAVVRPRFMARRKDGPARGCAQRTSLAARSSWLGRRPPRRGLPWLRLRATFAVAATRSRRPGEPPSRPGCGGWPRGPWSETNGAR